jgi:UDP-N-acetylmuramoyl-L-alanyl-D-glutamate--2,6-diaminopimelate ligase
MASPGDIVAITGKGHEKSMCFGTIETPWDDVAAVKRALNGN